MKQLVALSCAVLSFVVFDAKASFVVGAGGDTCGTWTRERQERRVTGYNQTVGWVLGYLRGRFDGLGLINESGKQKDPLLALKGGGADAVAGWLDKYCREHPLDRIFNASEELSEELIQRSR